VADDELRRVWADPTFDDRAWEPLTVPGHWRTSAAFADTDGPLLYRREFEAAAGPAGERAWLVLDGLLAGGGMTGGMMAGMGGMMGSPVGLVVLLLLALVGLLFYTGVL